jgi:hypothetical protein
MGSPLLGSPVCKFPNCYSADSANSELILSALRRKNIQRPVHCNKSQPQLDKKIRSSNVLD